MRLLIELNRVMSGTTGVFPPFCLPVGLCYGNHIELFQRSEKSCFDCYSGMADGSKYYSTHEPRPPLPWRRGWSEEQIRAAANSKRFLVTVKNKTRCHSC